MNQLSCPNCHSPHRAGARFCNQCGQPLPSEMVREAKPLVTSPGRPAPVGGASSSSVVATLPQPDESRPRRRSRAFAVAGGGCLLVIGVFAVAVLFVVMQLQRVATVPNIPVVAPTSRHVPIIVTTSPDAPVLRPTPQSEVVNAFPRELVGQWAYSDDNGSWLYSFNTDGSYQRVFEAQMVSMGCAITIKRYEEGFAAVDGSKLVLRIGAGEKTTTDSCDSSRNALRDLAGTTDTLAYRVDRDGDRVIRLNVDDLPLRPYSLNS
jgi:hypothetical protein